MSTSDVLASLAGTPESESDPPDVLSVITLLADGDAEFTCQPEDLCFAVPVRARRALAQERLPSCREPASFHPQAVRTETVRESVITRTGSPSAHPRPASGGATDFFLASALSFHQQILRSPGGKGARCVQPISATQTNCVHPHLARSRLLPQLSLRGLPTETKAPCGVIGGPDVSRRPKDRFGGSSSNTKLELYCLTAWRHERGRFLPTVLMRPSL